MPEGCLVNIFYLCFILQAAQFLIHYLIQGNFDHHCYTIFPDFLKIYFISLTAIMVSVHGGNRIAKRPYLQIESSGGKACSRRLTAFSA